MARNRQDANQDAQPVRIDHQAMPRVAQALYFRRMGFTYAEIAEQTGYANESGARKAIKKAEAGIIRDEGRALMMLQLDRINLALRFAVMPRILEKGDLWAVDRLVALLKRQAELMGLDTVRTEIAPQNVTRRYEVQHDDRQ